MKSWFRNLSLLLSFWPALIGGVLGLVLLASVITYFSDRALIAGNYWPTYAGINWFVDGTTILLFGLFVSSVIYKLTAFSKPQPSQHSGWFWWLFSALFAGCSSCTLTLATYLWLSSVVAFLPWAWLELKILWLVLLIRSTYTNIRDLLICKIK